MSERHYSLAEMAKGFGSSGTFSPELWDASNSGSEGQTYGSNNYAEYTRIGNIVFIAGRLDMAGLGTLTTTDSARIGNLPYVAKANPSAASFQGVTFPFLEGLALASTGKVHGFIQGNTQYISLRNTDTTGGYFLTIAEVSAAADIFFSGFYFTDDAV